MTQQVRIVSLEENRARTCSKCKKLIVWATTFADKKMPMQLDATAHYAGAPEQDEETGKHYWNVPAELTHFPHCNSRTKR
jgi:hypothetical protein